MSGTSNICLFWGGTKFIHQSTLGISLILVNLHRALLYEIDTNSWLFHILELESHILLTFREKKHRDVNHPPKDTSTHPRHLNWLQ